MLETNGITCSVTRRGNCYDNAVIDRFSSRVKRKAADAVNGCGEAKMKLFDYIEAFYNQRRRHSTLGQISPAAPEWQVLQHSPWCSVVAGARTKRMRNVR